MSDTVLIAQITDCHLQNDPEQLYRGLDVEQHLDAVLEDLFHPAEFSRPPDLILWTGDLIHHGGPQGYLRLQQRLAQLPVPSYWIPGNHDDTALMMQIGGALNLRTLECGEWVIILLDSTSLPDGKGSGTLAQNELDYLQQQLNQYSDRHCLVVLHHNPVKVQSGWQDSIMLANAASFWEVLHNYSQAKAVVCGHVHQDWDLDWQGVRVLMTPASSVEFKKCSDQFQLDDDKKPAYRLLELRSDGQIQTSVKRVRC
ncbi:metallophosphoesterase [Amphritea balenae]|uniref:Calcineurin-like phosphoesterase domain-containing protein n=1 Tax=Amphritea balenae TaxID=452629 RepID=A0A3P1SN40_9GAMM|nr:metallophosphoesterase [Amphritea balenae]RRC98537.1 hypothetical protein EHS89_13045 [Amphritea balenae]GGK65344.1 3',5'-cyclic adenosine monophosphate phosphodiesterase CpdA [Amphritea balenae]